MSRSLLPTSASPLLRAATAALAAATELPVPLRDLWNPDTCPVPLLPYLAWAFSVDRWDENWSEATKRAVIRASFYVHQHKGTIGALRRVVEPLGYLIEVIEWWQTDPPGPRGTFRLKVGVLDNGITDEMYRELERLIDDARPVSRHLLGLAISAESRGRVFVGAAAYLGDVLTVYPYSPSTIEAKGVISVRGAAHLVDTLSVYPS
ncbi:phage tail protein I [Crenobacter sp. SG2305]|uniref:phage tail protein I n=1 Tax=Crenobacter oryzisoli TaxID=3056844 RepID=UPI0025AA95D7|nr:phage tail protein I [Crenobacter sp. SG2305]MDN0081614.1 phage tail protein I [Crenobacter sp. SG2305]